MTPHKAFGLILYLVYEKILEILVNKKREKCNYVWIGLI